MQYPPKDVIRYCPERAHADLRESCLLPSFSYKGTCALLVGCCLNVKSQDEWNCVSPSMYPSGSFLYPPLFWSALLCAPRRLHSLGSPPSAFLLGSASPVAGDQTRGMWGQSTDSPHFLRVGSRPGQCSCSSTQDRSSCQPQPPILAQLLLSALEKASSSCQHRAKGGEGFSLFLSSGTVSDTYKGWPSMLNGNPHPSPQERTILDAINLVIHGKRSQ